jgi:excisionase family DNA binding protein
VDSTVISWLSLDELARYLKKPESTLYKLVNRGQLPGHKLGRAWRFDRDEVDRWIKRKGLGSPRPRARR